MLLDLTLVLLTLLLLCGLVPQIPSNFPASISKGHSSVLIFGYGVLSGTPNLDFIKNNSGKGVPVLAPTILDG